MQVGAYGFCGGDNVGEVGLAVEGEGCGYADEEGIGFGSARKICCCFEEAGVYEVFNLFVGDMLDIGLACVGPGYFLCIDVEAEYGEAFLGECDDEGRPT